jgi:hypothetical protein
MGEFMPVWGWIAQAPVGINEDTPAGDALRKNNDDYL